MYICSSNLIDFLEGVDFFVLHVQRSYGGGTQRSRHPQMPRELLPLRNLALSCYPCVLPMIDVRCTLLPLLYRPVCPSDSLRLANQDQVRGSCVSFESLGAVRSTSCRCVFPLRAWEPLDQAVRGSCVSFESLGGIGPGQCHGPGPMTPHI